MKILILAVHKASYLLCQLFLNDNFKYNAELIEMTVIHSHFCALNSIIVIQLYACVFSF